MENKFSLNTVISKSDSKVFAKIFLWMFIGFIVTGLVSWHVYTSGVFIDIIMDHLFNILLVFQFLAIILFSLTFKKCPPIIVSVMFFIYSILTSVTLSVIYGLYTLSSLAIVFFAAASIFGIMSIYGYTAKKKLKLLAPLFFTTIVVGIIIGLINLLIGNNIIDTLVAWSFLLVFSGITAYDIQKTKLLTEYKNISNSNLPIYGALQLYLDFINIFVSVLDVFNEKK